MVFGNKENNLYIADDAKITKWNIETKKEEGSWDFAKSNKKRALVSHMIIGGIDHYLIAVIKSTIRIWDLINDVILD